jgi:hypothetical protein
MDIKVLGIGGGLATSMYQETMKALQLSGLQVSVLRVDDAAQISHFGVVQTPALVLGNVVLVAGRVPSAREIQGMLAQRLAGNPRP